MTKSKWNMSKRELAESLWDFVSGGGPKDSAIAVPAIAAFEDAFDIVEDKAFLQAIHTLGKMRPPLPQEVGGTTCVASADNQGSKDD